MMATSSLVKTIWQPWSTNGLKPTRVWGNDGITCPCIAADGRDGMDARVALAIDLTGRPLATWTPMAGALELILATGASGAK
jgi:hypothetical protein